MVIDIGQTLAKEGLNAQIIIDSCAGEAPYILKVVHDGTEVARFIQRYLQNSDDKIVQSTLFHLRNYGLAELTQ